MELEVLNCLVNREEKLKKEIARRRQVEEELREGERFLNSIFSSIQDGLCVLDDQFNVLRVNPTLERWYRDQMPLVGKKCFVAFKKREGKCSQCAAREVLETGRSSRIIQPEYNSVGELISCKEIYSFPFIDQASGRVKGVIEYVRDITEKLKMEQEMARFEKLNLIGEMAAGIGHEVRNPMTTVRGFLQLLRGKHQCGEFKEYFDLMIDELDRANSIISEFLSLARNKPVNLARRNLNNILDTLYPLICADAAVYGKHVTLEKRPVPDLLMDEKEIRQMVLNLARNGLEAMAPGGTLTVDTFQDGSDVVLMVRDQGSGLCNEALEKLGTPFFTTKENGTGLGLAVCYSIAARHNATIRVDTGPDGTIFYVRLPIEAAGETARPEF